MTNDPSGLDAISIPYLLRHAGGAYARAMREALEAAGYDDIPKNGLYVIGGLASQTRALPLAEIIDDLGLSKQAAGQLVDAMVARGYLERRTDPEDRRRLIVSLTGRGRDAARLQTGARRSIDQALAERTSEVGLSTLRGMLAAIIGLGRRDDDDRSQPPQESPRLKDVVPILFVTDVRRAAAFFKDQLGFVTDFLHGDPPFYGSVSRGGARLHLRFVAKPNFHDLAHAEKDLILATVEASDIYALFAEFSERGAPIVRGLVEQPWGGVDFHVRDPDGNAISFVEHRPIAAPEGEDR